MITSDQIGFISDQIVKSRVTKPVITENSKFYFPIFYQRMSLITNILFGPDEDLSPDYHHHPIRPINPNFIFPLSCTVKSHVGTYVCTNALSAIGQFINILKNSTVRSSTPEM